MLDIRQEFKDATSDFIITEDIHIDEYESDGMVKRLLATRPNLPWLYEPLSQDLPTVQKDILIAMAAYYGDIDRDSRLRRPVRVWHETAYCIRGIYHNTLFALWWANQPESKDLDIEKAINAKFIMDNVLSQAPFDSRRIPYLIWWPTPIVRACIYANYEELFVYLLPQVEPDMATLLEADSSCNPYFRKAIDEEVARLGNKIMDPHYMDMWKIRFHGHIGRSSEHLLIYLDDKSVESSWDINHDGTQLDASDIKLMLCLPDAWKVPDDATDRNIPRQIDYAQWPPGIAREEE